MVYSRRIRQQRFFGGSKPPPYDFIITTSFANSKQKYLLLAMTGKNETLPEIILHFAFCIIHYPLSIIHSTNIDMPIL